MLDRKDSGVAANKTLDRDSEVIRSEDELDRDFYGES